MVEAEDEGRCVWVPVRPDLCPCVCCSWDVKAVRHQALGEVCDSGILKVRSFLSLLLVHI